MNCGREVKDFCFGLTFDLLKCYIIYTCFWGKFSILTLLSNRELSKNKIFHVTECYVTNRFIAKYLENSQLDPIPVTTIKMHFF